MATGADRTRKSLTRKRAAQVAADATALTTEREIDPETLAVAEAIHGSPGFFIQNCLSIEPMGGGPMVPFTLNPGQREIINVVEAMIAQQVPVRIICLKSRRQGISTLSEALVYWITSTRPHHHGIVLAHDKDISQFLFRISKNFYDSDKRHKYPGLMPEIEQSNEKALRFANPDKKTRHLRPGLKSSMLVETSEGRDIGRSLTLHAVHWAEVAYAENAGTASGLGIALSKGPGTLAIWESTANGDSGLFAKTWKGAVAGINEFTPIFLPWWIDPNCSKSLTKSERENWVWESQYEEDLYKEFKLSFEQLKFRRMEIASPNCFRPGYNPEDIFKQEYPSNWKEAFLKQGKSFFLPSALEALEGSPKGARKELYRAFINAKEGVYERKSTDTKPLTPLILKANHGYLTVWDEPIPGEDYAIGADVAEGLSHGDNHCAMVIKRSNVAVVARIKTRGLSPDEFGYACALLGWWYNEALLAIESNGPGIAANGAVRRIRYTRNWYDRDLIAQNENEPTRAFMGWRTTVANRRPILERLEEAIRHLGLHVPSKEFYDEARSFELVETGVDGNRHTRPQAAVGEHDDEVMALAIALQIHINGGAIRGVKPKNEVALDFSRPVVKDNWKKILTPRAGRSPYEV